jgi:glyoxylase-like metal-dependent hydrolase (beta-lactamase superfamily II)
VVVSHFHPDHVFGLMSKTPDNKPVFRHAAIYVPSTEFKFWVDPGIFTKLPENQARPTQKTSSDVSTLERQGETVRLGYLRKLDRLTLNTLLRNHASHLPTFY